MIIYGTRGVTSSAARGDFYCPQCRGQSNYDHKRVRRYFTLYFIPLIPLDLHGEYVECGRCKGTFHLDVLKLDPEADAAEFEAEFHVAVKRVMIEMMLSDGAIDDEEVETIRRLYGQLTDRELSVDEVHEAIEQAEREQLDVVASLGTVAGRLNDHGKEMVVKAAFLVAAADGEFQDEEKRLLARIGAAMGMTMDHVKGTIASLTQG